MTIFDHLFVLVFGVIYPIVGFFSFRRLLKRAEGGATINRADLYRHTAINHWILFLVALLLWSYLARPWSALGIEAVVDGWFFAALGLTIAGIVILLLQIRQVVSAGQTDLGKLRAQFGNLTLIVPQNGNELTRFYLLSITAGIVEELLWRGFMIWYLGQFMPLWAAAIVSTIGFGLAHAYQGLAHLPQITLVGGAFAGLYLLSGSIWLPMLLHTAVDILQGRLAYEVMHRSDHANTGMGELNAEALP